MTGKDTGNLQEVFTVDPPDETVPWIYRWTGIPHYYGDFVRELLISAALLMLITSPMYADNLSVQLPFLIVGAVVTVVVAALTNPLKRGVIAADTVVSGVGFIIFQYWALQRYQVDLLQQFILREAVAIVFLFALYFSTKTLRNMLLNTIGKEDVSLNPDQDKKEGLKIENEHQKVDFND
jgi:hypothetical protein